jgi:hypothetical protein
MSDSGVSILRHMIAAIKVNDALPTEEIKLLESLVQGTSHQLSERGGVLPSKCTSIERESRTVVPKHLAGKWSGSWQTHDPHDQLSQYQLELYENGRGFLHIPGHADGGAEIKGINGRMVNISYNRYDGVRQGFVASLSDDGKTLVGWYLHFNVQTALPGILVRTEDSNAPPVYEP